MESGLKRSEFAKQIGIHANTIANYENMTRQASYETLIKLADFFGVSLDYLLGKDVDPKVSESNEESSFKRKNLILTQSERDIITNYRLLSQKAKNRVSEYLELWQRQEEDKPEETGVYPKL